VRAAEWRAIADIAATQAGLVTASQLRMSGTSPTSINRLVAERRLTPVRNRVYVLSGVPDDPKRATRAVSLVAPAAVVSHRSAAWMHGLLSRPPQFVEVITPPQRELRLQGVRPIEARFSPDDVTDHEGIRVTTVVRTLIDLWAVLPPDWVERLVHDSVMRRLCEYDEVRTAADAAGIANFIGDGQGTTPLEWEWDRILKEAGLPEPVRQHQVVLGEQVFVLDHAWPTFKVALEVNGFVAHRTRTAFDRDHDKLAALQAAGWSVVSATARSRRAHVIAALRRLLRQSTAAGAVDCRA